LLAVDGALIGQGWHILGCYLEKHRDRVSWPQGGSCASQLVRLAEVYIDSQSSDGSLHGSYGSGFAL
jgi:hypothetical protein